MFVMNKIVLFGAGKLGKVALSVMRERNLQLHIVFCDNFRQGVIDGISIVSFVELQEMSKQPLSIYLTLSDVRTVYEQCVLADLSVTGIFDIQKNDFSDVWSYFFLHHISWKSESFIRLMHTYHLAVDDAESEFLSGKPLARCAKNFEFDIELSNLCNYAPFHAQCPVHFQMQQPKRVMSLQNVIYILEEIRDLNKDFSGVINFQLYNEPMIDPRLFMLLQKVKEYLPNAQRMIYTNGYYLTQTICDEIQDGIAEVLIVTGYGKDEFERLMNLKVHIPFHVLFGNLDHRLDQYNYSERPISQERCRALLSQIEISVNGDLQLCCLDYKHEYSLGNVFKPMRKGNLADILNSSRIREIQERLLNGDRTVFPLCQNCTWSLG